MESKKLAEISDQAYLFYQSFAHSNDAIMISDTEGNVLYSNAAFTDLYGYSSEEIAGKPTSTVRHPETPNGVFAQMWRAIQEPEQGIWIGDVRNRRKDGSAVDVQLTITAIKDGLGKTTAYLSIAVDITEKKQMAKSMIEQEKLFSIGLLASGIAHEIGSPLNVISGRAEMIKGQLAKDYPQAARSLDVIVQQTERISDLVKSLLNFSRPAGQRSPDTFSEIQVEKVLEESGKLLHKMLEERGVAFSVRKDADTAITWDFNKCEQVFINLLQNAIHAVEHTADPRVEISIEQGSERDLPALETPAEKCLVVLVRDNGSGIPPDHLDRIFDPFFTTKDIGVGTGLGLSVVYGLVKEIHGAVRVESALNVGTTFTLLLPAATA